MISSILSLKCGKIPAAWKISNVVPIPKKGLLKVVSNYRPISLLSIVSKVFERCVYNRLIAHVSINLHHIQFGILRGKSTTAQLLQVLKEIGEKLDKRVQTDIIYLDFAKAFDRVDHRLLVRKLNKFGIGATLLKWFEVYLTNRHQRVTVLGKTSHSLPVLSGVPQGSILGPLLFVIYVNDLPQETSTSSIALYADDTNCYRPVRSHKDEQYLQKDLDGINNWCDLWRMDLNQSKWEVLSVTRNLKLVPSSYHLKYDTHIKRTNAQKDLGVIITSDLKWNQHVSMVCAKANKMLGFIKRSSMDIRNEKTRLALYKTMVRSQMAYCTQIWSPQSVSLILQVENVQRRATRYILSLPFLSGVSYKDGLVKNGLLPLTYWHEFLDMVYLYKALVLSNDHNIHVKTTDRLTREYDGTAKIILQVPRVNTLTFQNSYYCRSPTTFNCLPSHLRQSNLSISQFKCGLFKYYQKLVEEVYDIDVPQTFKTVCAKCNLCRPLSSLSVKLCCH